MSALTDLVTNLNTIHTETMNKIIPGNIKAGVTIFGVTGTLSVEAKVFQSVAEMNAYQEMNNDDLAIVYGDSYIGTYRYDTNTWTQIGEGTSMQKTMDVLNQVLAPTEQYEGNGGTDAQINTVLDSILGIVEGGNE